MKLFYFKPESYGSEALVCAESEEAATAALRESLGEVVPQFRDFYEHDVADMIARRGYSLKVLDPGKVVWTERS